MDIYLYNSLAEPNRVNKISYLTYAMHLEGTLRSECSIITPYIQIEVLPKGQYVLYRTIDNNGYIVDDDNKRIVIGEDLLYDMSKFNYAYIPQFNRYYFINDIVSIRNTIWGIDMQVDTLMTYKNKFLDIECLIDRQEVFFNDLIPDNLQPCLSTPIVKYGKSKTTPFNKTLPNSNSGNKPNAAYNIVMSISGFMSDRDQEGFYPLLSNTNSIQGLTPYSVPYLLTTRTLEALYPSFLNLGLANAYANMYDTLANSVQNIIMFPFNIGSYIDLEEQLERSYMKFGNSTVNLSGYSDLYGVRNSFILTKSYIDISVNLDIPIISEYFSYGRYMNYNPYTKLELYIPYLGWIEINPDLCIGDGVKITYTISLIDGNTIVCIYNKVNNNLICSYECTIGYKIPISSADYGQKQFARGITAINGVLGSITGGIVSTGSTTTTDWANKYNYTKGKRPRKLTSSSGFEDVTTTSNYSFNPLGMIRGVTNTISNVASIKNNFSTGGVESNILFDDGLYPMYKIVVPKLYITSLEIFSDERILFEDTYAHTYGRPCQEIHKLSDLLGFTKVAFIHLENIPNATQGELEELEIQLTTGVLL